MAEFSPVTLSDALIQGQSIERRGVFSLVLGAIVDAIALDKVVS